MGLMSNDAFLPREAEQAGENVVLTPHVGVDSAEARMIIAHHTALNILPVLKGEGEPAFCVNRKELG